MGPKFATIVELFDSWHECHRSGRTSGCSWLKTCLWMVSKSAADKATPRCNFLIWIPILPTLWIGVEMYSHLVSITTGCWFKLFPTLTVVATNTEQFNKGWRHGTGPTCFNTRLRILITFFVGEKATLWSIMPYFSQSDHRIYVDSGFAFDLQGIHSRSLLVHFWSARAEPNCCHHSCSWKRKARGEVRQSSLSFGFCNHLCFCFVKSLSHSRTA